MKKEKVLIAMSGGVDLKIKLGVDGGPHEEIGELVQKLAAEKGLEVELVRFSDLIHPL